MSLAMLFIHNNFKSSTVFNVLTKVLEIKLFIVFSRKEKKCALYIFKISRSSLLSQKMLFIYLKEYEPEK
jgi:hypothetical protein